MKYFFNVNTYPSGDEVERGCYYKTMTLPDSPKCMMLLNQMNSRFNVELNIYMDTYSNRKTVTTTAVCTLFANFTVIIFIYIIWDCCKSKKPTNNAISNQTSRNVQRNQSSQVNRRISNMNLPQINDPPPPYSSIINDETHLRQ